MFAPELAVKNRTSVLVLALIILIFGTYCYSSLPRESEPDISIPVVFISTPYKGVAAKDIETSVTIPIEKKIKGLEGVKKVKSISSEGISQINIEFMPDVVIDDALQDVKDKVDEAKRDLPTDLEDDPAVFEVNLSEMPIVVFSLSGPSGVARLKEIADNLEDDIESIPGVLEVDITGGVEREIIIEIDPDKLSYYRIPITAFQAVVSSENLNTSGGSITLGDGRYQLRVPGEFDTPEEIYNLVVTTLNGRPVYLKDLARVIDGFKEETSRSRLDGLEAVNISVKKRSGENILAIIDAVDALIEEKKPGWPKGTEITKLMDKSKDVRNMVSDLENNILSGLILVVGVLFFALGTRNAILVAMAIPFSMLLSFTILYALGITLNMVVLFSLTLALGMLVDNAIVIVENIYRYMEQGVPRLEAAIKGSSEVAYPVIGSTLTTLAAFFPMLFWPGIMGEFMSYLPLTLIITLAASLFVALVINPALAAVFMKLKSSTEVTEKVNADDISRSGEQPVEISGKVLTAYKAMLEIALNNRWTMLATSFAMLVGCFFLWLLVIGLERPVEFFPSIDPKSIYVNFRMPEGADLNYVDRIVKRAEVAVGDAIIDKEIGVGQFSDATYKQALRLKSHTTRTGESFNGPSDFDNIDHIYAKSVTGTAASGFSANTPTHIGVQFLDLADRATPSSETMNIIRQRVKNIPGARITVQEQEEGPPTGAPINIEVSGDNMQVIGKIAKKIRQVISQIPFVEDVEDNFIESIPSIEVNIDRQKAALFNLSTSAIGFALKTAYNGLEVSSFREGDEDYDITVRLPEKDREVTDVLRKLMIPAPDGTLIPLTTLASISYTGTLGDITRIDHARVVTVKANVDETQTTGATARLQAEAIMKKFDMPSGYKYKFTGEQEEQKESQEFLSKAFLIAVFLIFLILVSLFNSVSQPMIIMTSVILSLGGVFLGLTSLNLSFGVIMSGVGVISLAGVVVNNAIVLIDYTNKLRENGLPVREAVILAGATRLRPVVLTAITTVLGLIPMVTGISFDFRELSLSLVSESSEWWRSMAIVVIFGLGFATFLTLVVVPTLYSLFFSIQEWFGKMGQKSGRLAKRIKAWYWKPFTG